MLLALNREQMFATARAVVAAVVLLALILLLVALSVMVYYPRIEHEIHRFSVAVNLLVSFVLALLCLTASHAINSLCYRGHC